MQPFFKNTVLKPAIIILSLVIISLTVYAASFYKSDPGTTITVNEHGVCKRVINSSATRSYFVPTFTTNEWSLFRSAAPSLEGLSLVDCAPSCFNLTVSSSVSNYNIYNAATAAGWTSGPVCLTINSGVYVYSDSVSTAAFSSGSFPGGTTITIVNNGIVMGKGGDGGAASWYGASAENGGNAMTTSVPLTIDNTNGYILGGGGGGGHTYVDPGVWPNNYVGGGGGAGGGRGGNSFVYNQAGDQEVPGGGGGGLGAVGANGNWAAYTSAPYYASDAGYFSGAGGGRVVSGSGGAGAETYQVSYPYSSVAYGGGAGGAGGASSWYYEPGNYYYWMRGGNGGSGGGNGGDGVSVGGNPYGGCAAGGGGDFGTSGGSATCNIYTYNNIFVGPGAGGKAINTNGNSITWTGGNNSTQVKGAVN